MKPGDIVRVVTFGHICHGRLAVVTPSALSAQILSSWRSAAPAVDLRHCAPVTDLEAAMVKTLTDAGRLHDPT